MIKYKVSFIQNFEIWSIYGPKVLKLGVYAQIWVYGIWLITLPFVSILNTNSWDYEANYAYIYSWYI